MGFFKWLWENFVFFEIFIINLEIKEKKDGAFYHDKTEGRKTQKKRNEDVVASVISYWTCVCQKSKQIDLFAISRKRFCLYEFSDNGHKIPNRNFINIPNLRKRFLYIWNIYEMYWTRKVAFHLILEKEANFEPLVELETFFESIFL